VDLVGEAGGTKMAWSELELPGGGWGEDLNFLFFEGERRHPRKENRLTTQHREKNGGGGEEKKRGNGH